MSKKEKYLYWIGCILAAVWKVLLLLLFLGSIYFALTKQPLWTVVCGAPVVLIVSTFIWGNYYADYADEKLKEEFFEEWEKLDEGKDY